MTPIKLASLLVGFAFVMAFLVTVHEEQKQSIRDQDFDDCVAIIGKVYEATANRELPTAPVGTLSWATSTNTH